MASFLLAGEFKARAKREAEAQVLKLHFCRQCAFRAETMRLRLILMRHAKSDWDHGVASDFDRPLNRRGRRDAPRIGRALRGRGWAPDWVVCSSSRRTRETWEQMKESMGSQAEAYFLDELYHAGPEELTAVLSELPESARTVLALGHNPGWQQAVYAFSGESLEFTTANAALLERDAGDWRAASQARGEWRLIEILRPKELSNDFAAGED